MCGECLPEGLRRRCRPMASEVSGCCFPAPPALSQNLIVDRSASLHSGKEDCATQEAAPMSSTATKTKDVGTNNNENNKPNEVVQVTDKVQTPLELTDAQLLARFNEVTRLPNFEKLVVQRVLKRTLWLLRACSYPVVDICSILAHASIYYRDTIVASGRQMEPLDMAHVLLALIYLAHCHIEDNTCPLNVWHRHLCKDYCTLKMFNAAILKLMSMRKWVLRVDQTELALRLQTLEGQGDGIPTQTDFALSFWAGGTSPSQANNLAMSFWAESGRKPSEIAVSAHVASPASTASCSGTSLSSPTSTAASATLSTNSSSASANSTDDEQQ